MKQASVQAQTRTQLTEEIMQTQIQNCQGNKTKQRQKHKKTEKCQEKQDTDTITEVSHVNKDKTGTNTQMTQKGNKNANQCPSSSHDS